MSIFDEDILGSIAGDNLNENIFGIDDEDDNNGGEIRSDDDNDNEAKDGTASRTKVEPKKRISRNPRLRLNVDVLTGSRGIHTVEDYFKNIKLYGKGHEKHDLDEILKRLQHWAHRMYPAYKFDDVLTNIDRLSKKKQLKHHLDSYRRDALVKDKDNQLLNDVNMNDSDDCDNDDNISRVHNNEAVEPFDEFDALLDEQIAISKLPLLSITTPNTVNSNKDQPGNSTTISSIIDTPAFGRKIVETSTPFHPQNLMEPGVTPLSQETATALNANILINHVEKRPELTPEQLERIAENRRIAQEKLRAKRAAINMQQNEISQDDT